MLSTYNDACLFNESFAYHLSTNYFRNPLFEFGEDCESLTGFRQSFGSGDGLDEAGGLRGAGDRPLSFWPNKKKNNTPSIEKQREDARNPEGLEKPISSNKNVHSYLEGRRKKFNKFCDNVTLTFKGKLFVMELNFKRRLSLMRNYFDRTMPWIMPSNHGYFARSRSKRHVSRDTTTDCNSSLVSSSGTNSDCFRQESGLSSIGFEETYSQLDGKSSFWADLKPPKSSECLGEQQEKILNRLARVKRISQKLFSSTMSEERDDCDDSAASSSSSSSTSCLSSETATAAAAAAWRNDLVSAPLHQTITKRLGSPARDGGAPWLAFVRRETSTMQTGGLTAPPPDGHGSMATSQSMPFGLGGIGTDEGPRCRGASLASASMKKETTKTSSASSRIGLKRRKRFIAGKHLRGVASALSNAKQHQKLCIVCYENSPNIVTLPCKHHDICSDCFIEIIYNAVKHSQYPLKCVLCRQRIEKIRCSRRLLLSVIEKNRTAAVK